jgi:transposase-like protein
MSADPSIYRATAIRRKSSATPGGSTIGAVGSRVVEELLAERGVTVFGETIRQWCAKFGAAFARAAKRRERTLGDTCHLDEVFVTIQG